MNRHAHQVPVWHELTGKDPYSSRSPAGPRLVPRLEPVVHGDAPGPLTRAQLQAFDADGYLELPDRLPTDRVRAALTTVAGGVA